VLLNGVAAKEFRDVHLIVNMSSIYGLYSSLSATSPVVWQCSDCANV